MMGPSQSNLQPGTRLGRARGVGGVGVGVAVAWRRGGTGPVPQVKLLRRVLLSSLDSVTRLVGSTSNRRVWVPGVTLTTSNRSPQTALLAVSSASSPPPTWAVTSTSSRYRCTQISWGMLVRPWFLNPYLT